MLNENFRRLIVNDSLEIAENNHNGVIHYACFGITSHLIQKIFLLSLSLFLYSGKVCIPMIMIKCRYMHVPISTNIWDMSEYEYIWVERHTFKSFPFFFLHRFTIFTTTLFQYQLLSEPYPYNIMDVGYTSWPFYSFLTFDYTHIWESVYVSS